jgi:ADP-ribose pyrophosphatase
MKPDWQRINCETLRDYRVVSARDDTYQHIKSLETRHFLVCDSADWVLVIPVTPDGDVVLIRQFRFAIADFVLEIPGGVIDPGETPEQAALRELQEETGYVAQSLNVCGSLFPNPALNTARLHVALARGCERRFQPNLEAAEQIQLELQPLSRIPGLIAEGQLCHALTIAAFSISGLLQTQR